MPRLKPIAVFITFLFMIAAVVAAGLAALPSHGAGAEGGNEPIVTNVNISPALNITRFDFYTLSVNVDPNGSTVNNVSFVIRPQTASVSNSNWDFFTNGSPNPNPNVPFTRAANESPAGTWSFDGLRPDNIYPEIAFIRGISSAPSNSRFWRDSYHLMNFTNHFNMSANTSFFIEIYATPKTSPPLSVDMQVFLVGKGFDISAFEVGGVFANEAWRNHADVELVGTISQDSDFHHTHSPNSSHFLIPLSTNSEGKIEIGSKTIDISGDFWVILTTGHQLQNRGWDLKYHDGENNGTWYKGAGTDFVLQSGRPDAHVHFARESLETYNGMEVHVEVGYNGSFIFESDPELFYFIELPNLPPNPSAFTAPAPGIYQGDVTISWLPAADANNDPLTYKVYLIGDKGTTLIDSGLTDTFYVLDTTVYDDGHYDIRVEACESDTDDLFCTSFNLSSNLDEGLCEFFRIWNGDPEDGVIGTTGNPYLICDVCDLQNMKLNLSAHYALNNSIDASATSTWNLNGSYYEGFIPVGSDSTPFTGSLNGSGYNISGLYINRSSTNFVGLFGYINGSSVSNVNLIDVDIAGQDGVGGLTGRSWSGSAVSNSSVSGNVSGINRVGGIVGYNEGTVNSSYAAGGVSGTGNDVGGLAGYNNGFVSDSYAMGNVSGKDYIGGLVGGNYGGNVSNSYSVGNVSGMSVGGLVGVNSGNVSNSFWDIQTSGRDTSNGGTGKNTSEMKSFATFNGSGWDIEVNSDHNLNDGYPYLSWQVPGNSPVWYIYNTSVTLNISSTGGGSVITPGEGAYSYNVGDVVSINASPDPCYRFVNWTGDTGNISDFNNPDTSITMNDSYSITANFTPDSAFVSGDGSAGNPYLIQNVCALQNMSSDLSAHYALNNSFDASATSGWNGGDGFLPVGNNSNQFTGSLDGCGYSISNLFINRSTTDYVGLFGHVNTGMSVSNVSLISVNVSGYYYVGGLVGYHEGGNTVVNSSVSGNVSGYEYVGGLVGSNVAPVSNCSATGNVNGSRVVGGLVGYNYQTEILNCNASGSVSAPVNGHVGGLVGDNIRGNVSGSTASVYVSGAYASGGLIGQNWQGNISDAHATGNVDSSAHCVGGLIGENHEGTAVNSTASGYVNSSSQMVGGLIGYSLTGMVLNCSASGNASGTHYAGGLIGSNGNSSVADSFATGNVSITGSCAGGLIGFSHTGSSVSNSSAAGKVSGIGTLGGLIGSNEDSPVSDSYATGAVNGSQAGVGGLMGQNVNSTVYNCSASGDVSTGDIDGNSRAGGLVGLNVNDGGAVSNCSTSGSVSATGDYVGGLIGDNWTGGSVSNCSATGSVSGYRYIGGLAGYSNGSVSDSYAAGAVSATGDDAGGLVGKNDPGSTVAGCYATGNVSGVGGAGGLVGENFGPVFGSYASGNASGNYWVGGLVGINSIGGNVSNAYATGNVSGSNHIGGLAGANGDASSSINTSYSIGYVNGSSNAGGLVGTNSGNVSNSFYDTDTSSKSDNNGRGVPKNTSEMKSFSTFFNASWDIEKNHVHNINDGYPYLSWQVPGNSPVWYIYDTSVTLNISSTGGGSVIAPGEGDHSYNVGDVVSINASPDPCYRFVEWTGTGVDASKVDFPNSASANITMDNDYNVTANFAPDSAFAGGDGSAGSPYLIQNVCALQNMSSNLSAHYALNNSFDASATSGWNWNVDHFAGFMPVGNGSGAFSGTFDGRGYTITGLFINRSAEQNVGLFGYVNPEWAIVSNVSLVGMNVIGGDYVGGLAGTNYGSVYNCSAAGNVSGSQSVGGLMGYNMGTVSNSSAAANVVGTYMHTGGLVGFNDEYCSITNSSAAGTVDGVDNVGGLAGTSKGPIDNSSSTASVDGDDDVGGLVGKNVTGGSVSNSSAAGGVSGNDFVGGLAGYSNGSISDSHAAGIVSGTSYIGGLVGHSEEGGPVAGCWAAGNVSGTNDVGGLLGHSNGGTVNNSHAAGNVSGSNLFAGGLIGQNNEGTVNNSYATGNVSVGHAYAGGLMGYSNAGAVANSYATGDVTSPLNLGDYLGGLVGNCSGGSIMSSYAAGNVGGDDFVGGLVGRTNLIDISNSYAMGNVTGQVCTGGLIGQNYLGTVNKSYAAGGVSGNAFVGGLVGDTFGNPDLLVTNSFWDTETSGLGISDGGTGKNTSEMKDFFTFFNASWDLICEIPNGTDDIWGLDYSGAGNNGYPFLWWQEMTHDVSFTLNMSSSDGGNVSTPGEGIRGPYNCSEVVAINASPDGGYFFIDWTGNTSYIADINNPNTSVTMYGNYSIQANFTNTMYNLSLASTPGGNVTAPGKGTFPYGSGHIVAINASPDPCYHFVIWTGDMGGNISDVNSPNTSITMNGNYSILANFAINTSTIRYINGSNGTITGTPAQVVNCGINSTQVTAAPDACYHFVSWNDSRTDNPRSDLGTSVNQTFIANFAINTSTIRYINGSNGTITGTPVQVVNCGINSTQVTAAPDACYHFVNWSDGLATAARIDPNVLSDITVTANFAIDTFTLTYTAGTGGTINGATPQTVDCGADGAGVTAVPDAGYNFIDWSDSVTNASRTETNVQEDIAVIARFRRAGGGGGGAYIPPYNIITINVFDDSSTAPIDPGGVLQGDVDAISPDGNVSIHIPAGTTALFGNGSPLTELNVDPIDYCPGPPDGKTVIAAFDFHPDGATFDPAIQITVTYDPADLPEGTDASQLVIAFYNEATGEWEYLSGTVNPDTNTITFSLTHFTIFAVMAPGECAPMPSATPTPAPTAGPTVTPTVEPTPTVSPTATPTATAMPPTGDADDDSNNRELLVIIIAACALLGALVGAIVIRNRKK